MSQSLSHHSALPVLHAWTPLAGLKATLSLWRRRVRERDELSRWQERDIRDAGMTRHQIAYETAKPFWRG